MFLPESGLTSVLLPRARTRDCLKRQEDGKTFFRLSKKILFMDTCGKVDLRVETIGHGQAQKLFTGLLVSAKYVGTTNPHGKGNSCN
jgi:hypothetical protein